MKRSILLSLSLISASIAAQANPYEGRTCAETIKKNKSSVDGAIFLEKKNTLVTTTKENGKFYAHFIELSHPYSSTTYEGTPKKDQGAFKTQMDKDYFVLDFQKGENGSIRPFKENEGKVIELDFKEVKTGFRSPYLAFLDKIRSNKQSKGAQITTALKGKFAACYASILKVHDDQSLPVAEAAKKLNINFRRLERISGVGGVEGGGGPPIKPSGETSDKRSPSSNR